VLPLVSATRHVTPLREGGSLSVAPHSAAVRPGPVHTGLTEDPDAQADRLLASLILPLQPMPPENAT
jgi:hypothetical protein